MEAEDIVASLSAAMDIDLPLPAREQFARELYLLAVHENRVRAESQVIGADSDLGKLVLYSVEDLLESDMDMWREGEWFFAYIRALSEWSQARAERH
jgi:hypothetical protein